MEPSAEVRHCHISATVSTANMKKPSETTSRSRDDDAKIKEMLNWTNHMRI